ncbi:trypsin-like peptidase domain protein [Mycobacterium kansasii]|uniref:Trypsin-like peptidase domain protein n=1 Tax=Mycobacterium kansasii TaxID=1768 RepID=A0A1V3XJR7_MYCKA|nr:trypsin-like peptidase domain protein [Mycobacterium kansasii]
MIQQRRPRAGMLAIGALTIAVVSAGIGGAAASVVELTRSPASSNGGGVVASGAPSIPAANMPAGSVEQVAAKVVPSVVMLETDLGRASEEGSGVILSSDGLILTNNHVVAAAAKPPAGAPPPKTTVTFSDGRTAPFTVVGPIRPVTSP